MKYQAVVRATKVDITWDYECGETRLSLELALKGERRWAAFDAMMNVLAGLRGDSILITLEDDDD